MKIQSLSVVVPNKNCINNCKFCVSRMHADDYPNNMDDGGPFFDLYLKDYIKRLEFARDNGCNTIMLTGSSEPQQNRRFLTHFGMFMQLMQNPFRWIEMQTTGVLLDDNYLRFLRNHVGVNLVSLSVSALDDNMNRGIIGTRPELMPSLRELCANIKKYGFSLRLSLNLTKEFYSYDLQPSCLFHHCKNLGADQVTLRILYKSGGDTDQDRWIETNALPQHAVESIQEYVTHNGKRLGILPHGAVKYSLDGLCVVIDADCMDKNERDENGEDYKYLILRPDCKLYSAWDDPASLIF